MIKFSSSLILTIGLILLSGSGNALEDKQHAGLSPVERINALRQYMHSEAQHNPKIYDRRDLLEFLQDEDGSFASKFLKQRNNHVGRAFKLAWQTLRWRHKMGIRDLDASHFPCDLFELGLIFESGVAHHKGYNGQYIKGNPVIWIRLGALGGIVKGRNEKFSAKKMWSSVMSKIKSNNRATTTHSSYHHSYSSNGIHHSGNSSAPGSRYVKDDPTMMHIMKAIAWWLEDWRLRNGPEAKATLVLDFENTDFAFSSWTLGEFFIALDDYFPNLFDQIIGFRYKPQMWSLHSPISMFNRIFKSRFATSPETDRKLRFVKSEVQISNYMPRVDVRGFTMLPDHVSGKCVGPVHQPPAGCQRDISPLVAAGLINSEVWSAVRNEFYNICMPQQHD